MVRAAAAGALLGAVLASGCGGDGRPSSEEYREQVNEICARYGDRLAEVGTPQQIEDVPEAVDQTIPIVEQEIADISRIEPPSELEDRVSEMLISARSALRAGERLLRAAEEGDDEQVRVAFERGNTHNTEADGIARGLGLDECADS